MRDRLEEASGKAMSQSLSRAFSGNHAFGVTHAPTAYKAQSPDKGTLVLKQLNDIFLYPITHRKRLNDSPPMW